MTPAQDNNFFDQLNNNDQNSLIQPEKLIAKFIYSSVYLMSLDMSRGFNNALRNVNPIM
jgi:hypothetical protein